MDSIKLHAPATIANISCGFDILGICLDTPYDEIEIKKISNKEVIINSIKSTFSDIPVIPNQNTGGIPALMIIKDYSLDFGFEINIKKGIPLCGGLGSSAATAAGVAYGINKLLNNKLSEEEIVKYALEGEKISSKTPHADNIGPCINGGFVIIKNTNPLELINVSIGDYYFSVIHPKIKVSTKMARELLPENIKLKDAVKQWGNIASLVYGFTSDNVNLIKSSMEDYIIEPVRSKLIPHYDKVKESALKNGAIGCSISGSGPSIFSMSESYEDSKRILSEMEKVFNVHSISYHSYLSKINKRGITIL
jgi:homoserine kinase